MDRVRSADGVSIAYEASGTGPALVVVNGAFGTRAAGAPLAQALESDFTVYRYDRRGRGDSEDRPGSAVERELEDLGAVVAATGTQPFVFGHSSGAALALEAAAGGVAMGSLVANEPPYVMGPGTSPEWARELEELVAAGRRDEAAEGFLRRTGAPDAVVEQTKAWEGWPGMVALAHTLAYDVRLCNRGAVPAQRLGQIDCPVLVTAGGLSPGWARETAETIAAAVGDGEWRLLPGVGHAVPTDVLAPLLRERFRPSAAGRG